MSKSENKVCRKCGSSEWGLWISSNGKINYYCKVCRRIRAKIYTERKNKNGGHHTKKQWTELLSKYKKCPICNRLWVNIPQRPDKRYKYVWTKDHIIPITKGGTDDISNIQPLCYQCNSAKCNREI
jgi:5-methylcytosine-specific restriction endonuclease McrA